jgi:hypothetical protein
MSGQFSPTGSAPGDSFPRFVSSFTLSSPPRSARRYLPTCSRALRVAVSHMPMSMPWAMARAMA